MEVVNRAYRDSGFLALLTRDPAEALKGYKLDEAAKAALATGDLKKIEAQVPAMDTRMRIWLSGKLAKGKW